MLKKCGRSFISLLLVFLLMTSIFTVAISAAITPSPTNKLTYDDKYIQFGIGSGTTVTQAANGSVTLDDDEKSVDIVIKTGTSTGKKLNVTATIPVGYIMHCDYEVEQADGLTAQTLKFTPVGGTAQETQTIADGNHYILLCSVGTGGATQPATFSWTVSGKQQVFKASLKNIELVKAETVSAAVIAPQNGSVQVGETTLSAGDDDLELSDVRTDGGVSLTAVPDDGYVFAGFSINGDEKLIAPTGASYTFFPTADGDTIEAVFVSASDPQILVGNMNGFVVVNSLGDAIMEAEDYNYHYIIPITDVYVEDEGYEYTIPYGVTLVVPNNAEHNIYTTEPNVLYSAGTNLYKTTNPNRTVTLSEIGATLPYVTLTLGENVILNIDNGAAVSVGGIQWSPSGGGSASVRGGYGLIVLKDGAKINVNDGASLYAWGFIVSETPADEDSETAIECASGAKVYEMFQIADHPGGTNAVALVDNDTFVFSQYYVQNIECKMRLEAGAEELVFGALTVSSAAQSTRVTFIGSSDALFTLSEGVAIKYYDYAKDKLVCRLDENAVAEINPMSLTVGPVNLDTKKFQLPISNIGVEIVGGSSVTMNQDVQLYPDSYVTLEDGSELIIQSNVYVVDKETTAGHVMGNKSVAPLVYSASRDLYSDNQLDGNGGKSQRTANSLSEPYVVNDGTVTIEPYERDEETVVGSLNVVGDGAVISGTGSIVNNTAGEVIVPELKLCDFTQSPAAGITEEPDTLCDDIDAAGEKYSYDTVRDIWHTANVTYSFIDEENANNNEEISAAYADQITVPTLTKEGYTLTWVNDEDYSDILRPGDTVEALGYKTYKANWVENSASTYTVTWQDEDGTVLETDTDVPEGTMPTFDGDEPTKESTAQYTYTFAGWTPEVSEVTGDVTYTASYTETLRNYTVTWQYEDGTPIEIDSNVDYGTMPTCDAIPTKDADARYTYAFSGWTPALEAVTGDVTYTAVFTSTLRTYTVTWKNEDGTVLETDENVPYGGTPSYNSATPTKTATAQYSYEFAGWTPEISEVTGDVTYTATYTSTANTYTVTWTNEDGTVLETDENVPFGETPSYDGAEPTKASTLWHTYSFTGWSPEVTAVTGDITYTAQFTENEAETISISVVNAIGWDNVKVHFWLGSETDEVEMLARRSAGQTLTASIPKTVDGIYFTGDDNAQTADITEDIQDGAKWVISNVNGTTNVRAAATYYLVGSMNNWADNDEYAFTFNSEAEDGVEEYMITVNLSANDEIKVKAGGNDGYWYPDGVGNDYTITSDGIYNIYFRPNGDGISDWYYNVIYVQNATTYTVTWQNEDGTVLETDENVPHGTVPSYDGATPTKAIDAQYTYTFNGWDTELAPVTANITYTAVYSTTTNKYTIKFLGDEFEDHVLQTIEVEYGQIPVYTGETPTKEATAQDSYTFAGWSIDGVNVIDPLPAVTGDATYKPAFTATLNSYKITWQNYDGTVLETDENVLFDTMPTYDGETPTKAADAEFTYTFDGWDPAVESVGGDKTYTAKFNAELNKYTIKFVNEDNTELASYEVEYGATPNYAGEIPTKAATAQYTYTFAGWNKDIVEVTEDATYTATFDSTVNKYTIKFVDEDGTELQSSEVAYGETPAYTGETPTKAADAQYTYTFDKWIPEISAVTGDATYTAEYSNNVNTYTVRWLNDDDSELLRTEYAYGDMPNYYGEIPTKQSSDQYDYIFSGWTPEPTAVQGDQVYTAVYREQLRTYSVYWYNDEGNLLDVTEVEYGAIPVYPGTEPTKPSNQQYTYTFSGWTPEIEEVTGDAFYTATFDSTVNTYTVTWEDEDGTVLQSSQVAYGDIPTYTGETPTKEDDARYTYTFNGWYPEIAEVTGDATYTAVYDQELKSAGEGYYVVGNFTDWGINPQYKMTAVDGADPETYIFRDIELTTTTEFKVVYSYDGRTIDDYNWFPGGLGNNYGENGEITADGTYDVYFHPDYTDNWFEGYIMVVGAGEPLPTEPLPTEPLPTEPPEPTEAPIESGYYIVGNFTDWQVNADYQMTAVEGAGFEEYIFNNFNLTTEKQFKVVYFNSETSQYIWFPDGFGNNYGENGEITADGDCDVYFRPDGNGNVDNGWHYGFIKAITAGTELPTEPEVTEPVYTPGYYIIGNFNNYEIDEAYMMSLNENQTEYDEFVFDDLALTTGSRFKVAYVDANGYQTTYPGSILADYGAWGQIKSNDTYTVYFRPDGNGDGAWYYGYIKVPGNFVPVEEGYYVIGDFTDWQLDAAYQMTVNPDADTTEYVFRNLNLTTDNQFKVVHTENGYETNTWYPDGIGNNYGENGEIPVNAAYDIYFRPNCDGEGWFYNYIFAQDLTPYTVTWYAEDGETVLETDENVLRGTAVSFDGEEPTKEGNAQYSYTFDGWDPAADTVTGNMSFIAKFKQITNKYTIKFVDEDGTELQSSEVEYGTTPVYNGETPTKAGDDQYTYIFNGWDSELAAVTGDKTYTATYRTTTNEYTIKFVNFDGAELQSSQVAYGEMPVYTGETPTKAGNAQYTYTFKDWDTAIEPVTGEKTYTATYDETVNKYTVTFINYDDSVLQSSEFEYGTAPSYEGETPIKPADDEHNYTFRDWDHELAPVTGDATYKAVFDESVRTYTITWANADGTVLGTAEVEKDTVPTYTGETPTKEQDTKGYLFSGWTPEITAATSDATYTAEYLEYAAPMRSLTLEGQILVNFYWALPEGENFADYTCKYTYMGETGEVELPADPALAPANVAGRYKIGFAVDAPEMTQPIAVTLCKGDAVIYTTTFKAADYAKFLTDYDNNPAIGSLRGLVQATMNYGAMAQKNFNVGLDDLADGYLDVKGNFAEVTQDMLNERLGDDTAKTFDKNVFAESGLRYYGASLVMNSNTKIKLYFDITDAEVFEAAKDSFGITDLDQNMSFKVDVKDNQAIFTIDGVAPANLEKRYVLTNGTATFDYAALDYVSKCLDNKTAAEGTEAKTLYDLTQALYWYNVYADAYFADPRY